MAKDNTNRRMREKPCKECGRVGHWHTFCSDACKMRHWRSAQKDKLAGEIRACDSWLKEDLPENEYYQAIDLLNCITSDKQARKVNDAIIIIIQQYHSEIRKAKIRR
jgi:predicted NBD/HSP70 family sugar kinase